MKQPWIREGNFHFLPDLVANKGLGHCSQGIILLPPCAGVCDLWILLSREPRRRLGIAR